MHPTNKAARIAGAVYLSMAFTAPFSLIYVPSKLIVRGDATATAANILAHETLWRFGIVADLIGSVIFVALAVALYRLFVGVNRTRALEMVSLILVSAAVGFMNVLNHIAALILFRSADFQSVFQKPQRDALGMLFIRLYGQGIVINELFWGLWLFPFAALVIQSRFLPRILGVLLIGNGLAYVIVSLTSLLAPQYAGVLDPYATIAETGELWIMLWLLIRGARGMKVGTDPLPASAF